MSKSHELSGNPAWKEAWQSAIAIYPQKLEPFAQGFHNRDNIFEKNFAQLVLEAKPLQFVGFWGVGGKSRPDQQDVKLLFELAKIRQVIESQYSQGADISIIMADTHGQFNGYKGFNDYLSGVWHMAQDLGLSPVALSHLYEQSGLSLPQVNGSIDKQSEAYQQIWSVSRYHRQINQLIESAAKHSQLGVDPELAAFAYVQMRHQEKAMLAKAFPNAAILVNGSKSLGKLTLPLEMPHMYLKVGPVWFQPGESLVN